LTPSTTGQISLNGVGKVTGDLKAINAPQLSAISADSLKSIGGKLDFAGLTTLSSLSFPNLTAVNQFRLSLLPALQTIDFGSMSIGDTFDLEGLTTLTSLNFPSLTSVSQLRLASLPALQTLDFGQRPLQAKDVFVTNTGLQNLTGLHPTSLASLTISNNPSLQLIRMDELVNITDILYMQANAWSIEVDFPTLQRAGNLSFWNISSLGLQALTQVEDSFACYGSSFDFLPAPNLTTIGSRLALVDNTQLSMIDFPVLRAVGDGILLSNNAQLSAITFEELTAVQGDMNLTGAFNSCVTEPFLYRYRLQCDSVSFASLSNVNGSVRVETSIRNDTICHFFDSAKSSDVIKGKVECEIHLMLKPGMLQS